MSSATPAAALADRVGRYVYVSSRSVYDFEQATAGMRRGPAPWSRRRPMTAPPARRSPTRRAKRGGELAAEAVFGDRALLARAGLILGPYEDIGRLPWWLHRIARGGDVLAPGPRDLRCSTSTPATWPSGCSTRPPPGIGGAFNVVSESGHATMGELLDDVRAGHGVRRAAALDRPRGDSRRRRGSRGPSCRSGCRPASEYAFLHSRRRVPGDRRRAAVPPRRGDGRRHLVLAGARSVTSPPDARTVPAWGWTPRWRPASWPWPAETPFAAGPFQDRDIGAGRSGHVA